MSDDKPTCPRCDNPIPDTAYVCSRCADVLAVALRHAASLWADMEMAVSRETRIPGSSTPPRKRRTLLGPYCVTCHHDSCFPIHKSQISSHVEDPISGETGIISFAAHEDAWIVTNTATTWARLVEEESGRPIPPETAPESKRADPKRILVRREPLRVIPSDRPDRCPFSDLPTYSCACGHHERITA